MLVKEEEDASGVGASHGTCALPVRANGVVVPGADTVRQAQSPLPVFETLERGRWRVPKSSAGRPSPWRGLGRPLGEPGPVHALGAGSSGWTRWLLDNNDRRDPEKVEEVLRLKIFSNGQEGRSALGAILKHDQKYVSRAAELNLSRSRTGSSAIRLKQQMVERLDRPRGASVSRPHGPRIRGAHEVRAGLLLQPQRCKHRCHTRDKTGCQRKKFNRRLQEWSV